MPKSPNSQDPKKVSHEQLEAEFSQWLDKKLDLDDAENFEQSIAGDEALKARLATARFIEQQVYCYEEQPVPKWDKDKTFESSKTPWWQWGGLPLASMMCSLLAITMVLLKVEIQVQDGGVLLSFAGTKTPTMSEQQITTLVDARLKDFAAEQELVLADFRYDLREKQQDDSLKLASYLLNSTRQERKAEMGEFLDFIDERQKDTQFDQNLRLEQLEYAVKLQQQVPLRKTSHSMNK